MPKETIEMSPKELRTLADNLEKQIQSQFEKPKGGDIICKECREELSTATKKEIQKLKLNDGDVVIIRLSPAYFNDFATIVSGQVSNAIRYAGKKRVAVLCLPDTDDYTVLGTQQETRALLRRYGFEYIDKNPMAKARDAEKKSLIISGRG